MKKFSQKDFKKLQVLWAWSEFYTKRDSVDSKGEPINRIRYRTDLLDIYNNIQDEIAAISAKYS